MLGRLFFTLTAFFLIATGVTDSFAAADAEPNNEPTASFKNWLKANSHTSSEQNNASSAETPSSMPTAQIPYQEQVQMMRQSVPQSPLAPVPFADEAFQDMMHRNMPLTPEQVVQLRQLIDLSQQAAAVSPVLPPKPVSTTLLVSLAPGVTPPVIRVAQGFIASLVFVDSTGAPWPIASFDNGDPTAFNVQWENKSNVLLIQAQKPYVYGNMAVQLVTLPTPIMLTIIPGQKVIDYRVDLHVPGIGPNAKPLMTEGLPTHTNELLLQILDGVPPAGAKRMTVAGGRCQAWVLDDKLYLRTRLTILSPGWIGRMASSDGMQAYEMSRTPSVLVSQFGKPIELKIEGT